MSLNRVLPSLCGGMIMSLVGFGETQLGRNAVLAAATGLRRSEEGLWVSSSAGSTGFSESAHGECYQLEENSFWFAHRNRCIAAMVSRHRPTGVILDVGGGNGYVASGLRVAGFDTIVVEPGLAGARNAMQRGLDPVLCSTLSEARFREGSVPAIGMFDVVEHVDDPVAFLAQTVPLLGVDGRLYLTVPAYDFLWSSEDVAAGHLRRFPRERACAVVRASGLKVDFASYFFMFLPAPIFLFRRLPHLLGRRPSARADAAQHGSQTARTAVVRTMLDLELQAIRAGMTLPFGASIMVAARKVRNR